MRRTIPLTHSSGFVTAVPVAQARNAAAPAFRRPLTLSSLAILAGAAVLILAGALLRAQTTAAAPAPAPASTATPKPPHTHKHSPAHLAAAPAPAPPAPVTPPEPPKPNWPAYEKPAEASVVWDSQGLRIDAANSSLEQILKDISTATGAKVEGLAADQRVFGQYGPGQARDVLSQLLQGSGYNVIMIGDQGQGAPRQILLSARQAGGAQPSARPSTVANNEEDEVEEQPASQEQPLGRPGFPPGGPPRSPQQIMQEMQQRQQQMNPQGQPQQPNNPQN
ncbi:MAG TPA: hypothetical protein VN776_03650 [Terracidiphilus sp.]|nr:hypothetical protein [Terracidiphilus sp.]